MSENRTFSIMLFVLGLFLVAVGIGLWTADYVGIGAFVVLIGIIILFAAFVKIRSSKKTVSMTTEMPKWKKTG